MIAYLDLGPVKPRQGNKVEPIWVVTNGPSGQRNVIYTVPGKADYTPLWALRMVTWKSGAGSRILRSAAAVRRAQAAGDVEINAAPIVVNCPVL